MAEAANHRVHGQGQPLLGALGRRSATVGVATPLDPRAPSQADLPSGWWILPCVIGGLAMWVMIFRALIGWLW
jgi:hypothetical protein